MEGCKFPLRILAATLSILLGLSSSFAYYIPQTTGNPNNIGNLSMVPTLPAHVTQLPTNISLVQSNAAEGTGTSTVVASFNSNNTAGNLIIVAVRISSLTTTVGIADTQTNTYSSAISQPQATNTHQIQIFYAANVKAGANTVTATYSASDNHPWMAIYEYSGLTTISPLDQVAGAQGSNATPNSGLTPSTIASNELVFAELGLPAASAAVVTPGLGFTLRQQDVNTSRAATEDMVVGASNQYAGSFALSGTQTWSAAVATFIAAGVPGAYQAAVSADAPDYFWRLNETSGTVATDSGTAPVPNTGTYVSIGSLNNSPGAVRTGDPAAAFNGTSSKVTTSITLNNPYTAGYSVELWFKTTSSGPLLQFNSSQTVNGGGADKFDRQLYVGTDGKVYFGQSTTSPTIVISPLTYADGNWHYVAGTYDGSHINLYIDGNLVAGSTSSSPGVYSGFWALGAGEETNTWPNSGGGATVSTIFFNGQVQDVAVYNLTLSNTRIYFHYIGTNPTLNSISVTPANPTVNTSSTQQFTATGNYSNNGQQNVTSSCGPWSSSNTTIATINSSGLATTTATAGSTTIACTIGSVSGNTLLTSGAPIAFVNSWFNTGNGTTVAVNTGGTGSNGTTAIIAGDVCVLDSDNYSGATINSITGGANGTWTSAVATFTNATATHSETIYYHIVTSADVTSAPTFTVNYSVGAFSTVGIGCFRNVSSSTPIDVAGNGATGGSTSLTASSVILGTAGDALLYFGGVGVPENTATLTQPAGFTAMWNSPFTANTNDGGMGSYQLVGSTTGATGAKSATASTSVQWTSVMVALKAGAFVPPTLVSIAVGLSPSTIYTTPNGAPTGSQATATGTYSDSSTQNITTACSWSSNNTNAATVGLHTGIITSGGTAAASVTIQCLDP